MSNSKKSYIRRNKRGPKGTYAMRQVRERQDSQNVVSYVITVPRSIGDAFRDKGIVYVWSVVNIPGHAYHGNIMLTPVLADDANLAAATVDSDAAAIASMFDAAQASEVLTDAELDESHDAGEREADDFADGMM